jgi:heptosyltransferase I
MPRVLLIKLTSLGDLIHALPALSDAQNAKPGIGFDWVIDENFQEIATWHPAVKDVITTNHREWRGAVTSAETHGSISKTIEQMRAREYDLVIDGQGNFKTGLLSLFSKGPRAGFDSRSVREWVAHLAYQRRYAASKNAHAIERLRRLFASALDYPLPGSAPDFRIQRDRFLKPKAGLPDNYLVFIHNASWKTKLWPERHWTELIGKCVEAGFRVLLPWGNGQEEERARRLAKHSEVQVLPRLSLSEIGYVLARARACVCMDTGLSHLAAALDVPAITLYGSTDSGLIGASGASQVHIKSERFCSPCQSKTCRFSSGDNPCLEEIGPERVFGELLRVTGSSAVRPIPASRVSA